MVGFLPHVPRASRDHVAQEESPDECHVRFGDTFHAVSELLVYLGIEAELVAKPDVHFVRILGEGRFQEGVVLSENGLWVAFFCFHLCAFCQVISRPLDLIWFCLAVFLVLVVILWMRHFGLHMDDTGTGELMAPGSFEHFWTSQLGFVDPLGSL